PGAAAGQQAVVAQIALAARQAGGPLRLGAAALVQAVGFRIGIGAAQQVYDVAPRIAHKQAGGVDARRIRGQVLRAVWVLVVRRADTPLVGFEAGAAAARPFVAQIQV